MNGITYVECWWRFDAARFANDVKAARERAGLTQKETDAVIGMSSCVANIEVPRRDYRPHFGTFEALVNLFDLDPRNYFEVL